MDFSTLKGRTLAAVEVANDNESITFRDVDGQEFKLFHSQDCCESVRVEEIVGDVSDLIGTPLLEAEEVSGGTTENPGNDPAGLGESWTWTFYKLGTIKGHVTLRWLGTSNGYYSERVDFCQVAA